MWALPYISGWTIFSAGNTVRKYKNKWQQNKKKQQNKLNSKCTHPCDHVQICFMPVFFITVTGNKQQEQVPFIEIVVPILKVCT